MLLILFYIALAALIVWSIAYLIWRIVRSFLGKGGCSCGCCSCAGANPPRDCGAGNDAACGGCSQCDHCQK